MGYLTGQLARFSFRSAVLPSSKIAYHSRSELINNIRLQRKTRQRGGRTQHVRLPVVQNISPRQLPHIHWSHNKLCHVSESAVCSASGLLDYSWGGYALPTGRLKVIRRKKRCKNDFVNYIFMIFLNVSFLKKFGLQVLVVTLWFVESQRLFVECGLLIFTLTSTDF